MSDLMQQVPEGYKLTEVGVIPEDWSASTVGENTYWSSGGTPNRKRADYWEGNIPWISGSTLKKLEISTSDQFLTPEGVAAGSNMAPVNATLLLVRGSALHNHIRVGLVVSPVAFNQDVKALVPRESVFPKYLTFYMKGMESELLKLVSSAGNSAGVLDTELVKGFRFLRPKLEEQIQIANALNDVDTLITSLEKLIAKKRAIKTAAMQQLLTGKKRLPPFDKSHTGYKQTELGVIPEDWEVMALSDITQAKRPISYGIVQTGSQVSGGIRCLRVIDISNGNISKDNLITTTVEISNSYRRTQLQLNDLVIPLRGKVGEVGLIDADLVGDNLTRGVALIALTGGYSSPFIKQVISFEDNANRIENSMNGSALQEISIAALRSFKISIPSASEQEAIADVLSGIDKDLDALGHQLIKTKQLKQGMMQELLTGKTRLVTGEA